MKKDASNPVHTLSKKLEANYADYYNGESTWRKLSAVDKAANIVSLCSSYTPRTVLEIGAGDGAILQQLSNSQFGEQLYALEISQSGIQAIRQRDIWNLTECALFNGNNIPYEDGCFDLAILSHVLEHVEYPRQLLHEANRVAKYIFIEVPLEDTLRMKPDFVWDKVGHINFFSPKTIRKLVQTCGLEVLAQTISNPSYGVHQYLYGKKALLRYLPRQALLKVVPNLATHVFTYHCALLCRTGYTKQ